MLSIRGSGAEPVSRSPERAEGKRVCEVRISARRSGAEPS